MLTKFNCCILRQCLCVYNHPPINAMIPYSGQREREQRVCSPRGRQSHVTVLRPGHAHAENAQ